VITRTLSDGVTTITLHHLIWLNRSRDNAAGSSQVTLGGRLVIRRIPVTAGKEILLGSVADGNRLRGWFTWDQVDQFKIWRDNGTTLTMVYDTETRRVTIPLGGVSVEPFVQYSKTPGAEDIGTGTLTLTEV